MTELESAVSHLIKVDYAFRFSITPYTAYLQEQLLEAEEKVRFALTGQTDPVEAARVLGVNVSHQDELNVANALKVSKQLMKKSVEPSKEQSPISTESSPNVNGQDRMDQREMQPVLTTVQPSMPTRKKIIHKGFFD